MCIKIKVSIIGMYLTRYTKYGHQIQIWASGKSRILYKISMFKYKYIFDPNSGTRTDAPPPTTRERPPGCRTIFVGGLPENATEDTLRELFNTCGNICSVRLSKKNFAHIRFEVEESVFKALYVSGMCL